LGYSEALAYASVRFGIGRFNTTEEIDQVAQHAIATIQSLRQSQATTSNRISNQVK
jgi:cysteine desulfurase